MKIFIYGSTKERAFSKFDNLISDERYGNVLKIIKTRDKHEAILGNGDKYITVVPTDNSRGQKWNYAYVDSYIDLKVIETIIMPSYSPSYVEDDGFTIKYNYNVKDIYEYFD